MISAAAHPPDKPQPLPLPHISAPLDAGTGIGPKFGTAAFDAHCDRMFVQPDALETLVRTLQYIMVFLMIGGMVAFASREHRNAHHSYQGRIDAQKATERLHRQIQLESVLNRGGAQPRIYPESIDPEWFKGDIPRNTLLERGRPWVEIAPESQHHLDHPPTPIAVDESVSEFWYNPARGIVRARVPARLSDADALETYNFVNNTALQSLLMRP